MVKRRGIILISSLLVLFLIGTQILSPATSVRSTPLEQTRSPPTKNYGILEYNYPWPPYDLKPPWRSAMAQAQAIQILLKAYNITGDRKFINATKDLLNAFFVDVKDGGVTYKTQNNGWWYELLADSAGKHPKVLNGMLWTLLSLYDYYNITKDASAKYLFEQGILALKNSLRYYDGGNYTYYDIYRLPAKVEYHKLHIQLLGHIYNITREPIFKAYYEKWKNYDINAMQHLKQLPVIVDYTGVPIVDYGIINGTYIGLQRNPVVIDHKAQDFYNSYIQKHDLRSKQLFLNNANWLTEHMTRQVFTDNIAYFR